MVLADRCCSLVQEIFSGVSDAGVNFLDFGFRLFPVTTELRLTTHAPLVTGKALLMFLEAVEWCDEAGVAHGGEPRDADIDADGGSRRGQWLLNFALRLDRGEPLATRLAYRNVTHLAQYITAVAVAYPAKFRQENAVVGLIKLDLFRLWIAETVTAALLFKAREVGAFSKKIGIGSFQILQRMLQCL